MLSQKMSKEAVLVDMDYNVDANVGNLLVSKVEFEQGLSAMMFGNEELGINQTALPSIRGVNASWRKFEKYITEIIKNYNVSDKELGDLNRDNLKLLKVIEEMIDTYWKTSKLYEINQSQMKSFIFSGQLEMLTQKMAKEFFLISQGIKTSNNIHYLTNSIGKFDKVIDILLYGNVRFGVIKAPSKPIADQLRIVKFKWKIIKYKLEREPNFETITQVELLSRDLLEEVHKATHLIETFY